MRWANSFLRSLAFAAACARHSDAVVDFWFGTMMNTKAEMTHRIACSVHLINRAHGLPVQVTNENVTEHRKTIFAGAVDAAGSR